jgi:hypothetical protein
METIILVVIALQWLLSVKTRIFAYVLFVLLLFTAPLIFIVLLPIAIFIHFFHKSKQRKFYEPPTLPRND